MGIIDAIKQKLGMGSEEIEISTFAIIDWQEEAAQQGYKGNLWKRIAYIRNGSQNFEYWQYSPEMIELLNRKRVPIYDMTLGYNEPLSSLRPADFQVVNLGTIKSPTRGIELRK